MSAGPASQEDATHRDESKVYLVSDTVLGAVERYGKATITLAGVLYVIGLLASIWYYNQFHVRSIELLRTQYILTGVWYCVVFLLHLTIPRFILKRWWQRVLYMLFGLMILVNMQSSFGLYLQTLVEKAVGSKPYFEFTTGEATVLKGEIAIVVIRYLSAIILFWFGYRLLTVQRRWGALCIAVSVWINFQLFSGYIFSNVPQTLGGGEPVVVQVQFTDKVPEVASMEFDVSRDLKDYSTPWYYARLIHMDEHTIFLKSPRWFSNDVYEFERAQVQMLRYTQLNPVEFGTPKKFRRFNQE